LSYLFIYYTQRIILYTHRHTHRAPPTVSAPYSQRMRIFIYLWHVHDRVSPNREHENDESIDRHIKIVLSRHRVVWAHRGGNTIIIIMHSLRAYFGWWPTTSFNRILSILYRHRQQIYCYRRRHRPRIMCTKL